MSVECGVIIHTDYAFHRYSASCTETSIINIVKTIRVNFIPWKGCEYLEKSSCCRLQDMKWLTELGIRKKKISESLEELF